MQYNYFFFSIHDNEYSHVFTVKCIHNILFTLIVSLVTQKQVFF